MPSHATIPRLHSRSRKSQLFFCTEDKVAAVRAKVHPQLCKWYTACLSMRPYTLLCGHPRGRGRTLGYYISRPTLEHKRRYMLCKRGLLRHATSLHRAAICIRLIAFIDVLASVCTRVHSCCSCQYCVCTHIVAELDAQQLQAQAGRLCCTALMAKVTVMQAASSADCSP